MTAPIGATVTITYDATDGTAIRADDFLRTPAGRCYRVLAAHRMRSKHPNRWRLHLLVIEQIPLDDHNALLFPLVFYPRGK